MTWGSNERPPPLASYSLTHFALTPRPLHLTEQQHRATRAREPIKNNNMPRSRGRNENGFLRDTQSDVGSKHETAAATMIDCCYVSCVVQVHQTQYNKRSGIHAIWSSFATIASGRPQPDPRHRSRPRQNGAASNGLPELAHSKE